jgi:hypothetical protein
MKHPLDHSFSPFLPANTLDATLQSSTSTALGPDGLTSLHLKHLSPNGIAYLTDLYNLSLAHANLPAIWKKANIVPIPKPGKPANQSSENCPISLLSPAVKILERLLLPFVSESLPVSSTQHGYRPLHSTTTALLPIATKIAIGFNEKKPARRTATVSLDISKAFDVINHDLLWRRSRPRNFTQTSPDGFCLTFVVAQRFAYSRGPLPLSVPVILECRKGPSLALISSTSF